MEGTKPLQIAMTALMKFTGRCVHLGYTRWSVLVSGMMQLLAGLFDGANSSFFPTEMKISVVRAAAFEADDCFSPFTCDDKFSAHRICQQCSFFSREKPATSCSTASIEWERTFKNQTKEWHGKRRTD